MASKAQDPGTGHRGGLADSLKVLAATLLAIAHTRLELISIELEEQGVWLSSMLVWALVGLFCAGLGVVLVLDDPEVLDEPLVLEDLGHAQLELRRWDVHLLVLGPAGVADTREEARSRKLTRAAIGRRSC